MAPEDSNRVETQNLEIRPTRIPKSRHHISIPFEELWTRIEYKEGDAIYETQDEVEFPSILHASREPREFASKFYTILSPTIPFKDRMILYIDCSLTLWFSPLWLPDTSSGAALQQALRSTSFMAGSGKSLRQDCVTLRLDGSFFRVWSLSCGDYKHLRPSLSTFGLPICKLLARKNWQR